MNEQPNQATEQQAFDQWALVELFGHTRIAGRVTEQSIAGGSFLRVDVPETEGTIPFTRFFGAAAIYAINPVTENVARSLVARMRIAPITEWDIDCYNSRQLKQRSDTDE